MSSPKWWSLRLGIVLLAFLLLRVMPEISQHQPYLVFWGAIIVIGLGVLMFIVGMLVYGRYSEVYDYETTSLLGRATTGVQARQWVFRIGAAGGFMSVFGCFIFNMAALPLSQAAQTQPLTTTLVRTPSATRTPLVAATEAERQRQATATQAAAALSLTATQVAQWPVVFEDHFERLHRQWRTGAFSDETGSYQVAIANGVYHFTMNANESFYWIETPQLEIASDFSVSVDAQQIEGSSKHDFGLVFGWADDGQDLYQFVVSKQGWFGVWHLNQGNWGVIVKWQRTAAMHRDGFNRLTVNVVGREVEFFINGQSVAHHRAVRLPHGQVGVIFDLTEADEQAVFVFDNFEIRVPPDAPTPAPIHADPGAVDG